MGNPEIWTAAILTISDKGARGERLDTGGEILHRMVEAIPAKVIVYDILPDEQLQIEEKLKGLADRREVDIIFTTGGTGVSPRDVTPEATVRVLDRQIPGMAEAMRMEGFKKNPRALISRGLVGTRGTTLIVNLPGSPKGIREGLEVILPILSHVLEKLQGDTSECA